MSLFNELRRRNVFRVAIAYVITAWLVMQVADVMINNIGAPGWLFRAILLVLGIGFFLAVFFAWAFELTPEGIKREKDVDRSQSITPQTARQLDRAIIVVLVLAVAYFIWESRFAERPASVESEVTSTAMQQDATPTSSSKQASAPSIAVLPFADMSASGDQVYFSDGIAEELLNLLVRVEGLEVASRTSSFAFKGSQLGLDEIARELGVDHILEGSVRKAEDRVRITAQLIDASRDRHLWSDTFDRTMDDIFAIQDEIANAIVGALQSELGLLEGADEITVEADTGNVDAYELYLEGRQLFIARDRLPRSMELLERALELDPDFARAWETLAAVYSVAPSWGITDRAYLELSNAAAERALQLDDGLSMAWAVLGSNAANDAVDYIRSIDYLDRALARDPRNTTALLWRSIAWTSLGFFERAIQDGEACLRLDPRYENCRRHLALAHLSNGDTDRAMDLYLAGLEVGFYGSADAFVYPLFQRGNRVAAAMALWRGEDDIAYPGRMLLEAMAHPEADSAQRRQRFLRWLESAGEEPAGRVLELLVLGAYEYVTPNDFGNGWVWHDVASGFRASEYFKPMIREHGWLKYWREREFPPMCRPVGADDFACDADTSAARDEP